MDRGIATIHFLFVQSSGKKALRCGGVELRHQAALATRGVVRVNDALAGGAVEHADRVDDSGLRLGLIALGDREFGLLDEGAAS